MVVVLSGALVAVALFAHAAAATVARWLAGRHGDRHGAGRLLTPGVVMSGLGILALVVSSHPAMVVAGMAVFGAGFGVAQNASLAVMYERVEASGYGAVSAVWNLAYDGGYGVGAVGFGVVAAATGYRAAFGVTVVLVLAAVVPALRDGLPRDNSSRDEL